MQPEEYEIHGNFAVGGGATAPKIAGLLITAGAVLAIMKFAGFRFNVGVSN
jgi:hypothetical protein